MGKGTEPLPLCWRIHWASSCTYTNCGLGIIHTILRPCPSHESILCCCDMSCGAVSLKGCWPAQLIPPTKMECFPSLEACLSNSFRGQNIESGLIFFKLGNRASIITAAFPNQCQNCSLKDPQPKSLIRFSVLINSKNLLCVLLHLGIHLLVSLGFWGQQIPHILHKCWWSQTWSVSKTHPAPLAPSQSSFLFYCASLICL